jgi:hypothetical protein
MVFFQKTPWFSGWAKRAGWAELGSLLGCVGERREERRWAAGPGERGERLLSFSKTLFSILLPNSFAF